MSFRHTRIHLRLFTFCLHTIIIIIFKENQNKPRTIFNNEKKIYLIIHSIRSFFLDDNRSIISQFIVFFVSFFYPNWRQLSKRKNQCLKHFPSDDERKKNEKLLLFWCVYILIFEQSFNTYRHIRLWSIYLYRIEFKHHVYFLSIIRSHIFINQSIDIYSNDRTRELIGLLFRMFSYWLFNCFFFLITLK